MRRLLSLIKWTHLIRQTALLVFVVQFVHWFQHYWLSETAELVYTVVGILFVVELLLFKLPLWLRLILHLAGILAAHLFILEWHSDMLLWDSWRTVSESLPVFAGQFLPYLWFGLAAWLIYVALDTLLLSRQQVFIATVMSVIAMAIADSYTTIYLWDETSLVVVSGLILMINRHFDEFREKHPHTWRYISDYPWGITLTAGTLVAFIVLMSVISPNVRPLLVDPYTAWNQLQGKSVNFSMKEDTQTALASFSLNLLSSSGYGRDDSELGGGFNYNYDPVFQVTTKVRSYWRGESKAVYTGSGWIGREDASETAVYEVGEELAPEVHVDESVPVNTFTQRIVMIDEDNPPKIFAAYPISRIDAVNGASDNGELFVKDMFTGAVEPAGDDTSIRAYTVTSAVPVASEQLLMEAPVPELERDLLPYVQLPDTLPDRVYDLVEEITAEADTPYAKVKAIETYLRTNYSYTNTPDESKGTSEDFVDRFLFEILEGYCDYFSTAMAVMVRTLDVPARWVKGYTAGIMDDESAMMYEQQLAFSGGVVPDMELTYTVRNSDAHSWVEVYFEGYGWIMFEPTAGFTAPVISSPVEESAELVDSITTERTAEERAEAEISSTTYIWAVLIPVALVIVGLLVWIFGRHTIMKRLRGFRRFMVRVGLMRPPENPNEQIVTEFNRLLKYLDRKGLVREEHQTVREAVAEWGGRLPAIDERLKDVLYDFELAKYSRRRFNDQDVERYQRKLRELRHQVKKIA